MGGRRRLLASVEREARACFSVGMGQGCVGVACGGDSGCKVFALSPGRGREAVSGLQASKEDPFGRKGSHSHLRVTRQHMGL